MLGVLPDQPTTLVNEKKSTSPNLEAKSKHLAVFKQSKIKKTLLWFCSLVPASVVPFDLTIGWFAVLDSLFLFLYSH